MKDKFELYEENGVLEYWIVDPDKESILVYTLNENNQYIGSKPFVTGESVASSVLKGFVLEVSQVFEE